MVELVIGGSLAALFGGLFVYWSWSANRSGRAMRIAARRLRLHVRHVERSVFLWMDGTVDGLKVRVEPVAGGDEMPESTRFWVESRGVPAHLSLRAEGRLERLKDVASRGDVVVGDRDFDDRVHVTGPEEEVAAALGEAARRTFLEVASSCREASVDRGQVFADVSGLLRDPDRIERTVLLLIRAVRALQVPSIPEALMANARTDPSPEVRLRNLRILSERHAKACEATLREALGDPSPAVRLLAARGLADDAARQALVALAEDAALDLDARTASLQALRDLFPYARVASALARALERGEGPLQAQAFEAIVAARDFETLMRLQACALGAGPEAARLAARALGKVEDARAESLLVKFLEHSSEEARRAAALALGRRGTVGSVEALLAVQARSPGPVAEAARDAVRAIQGRLGDAGAGRLSVAPVPDGEAGLSLPAEETPAREKS